MCGGEGGGGESFTFIFAALLNKSQFLKERICPSRNKSLKSRPFLEEFHRPGIVVVVLLFYVLRFTSKVMSGRSVNLTTLFVGRLRPPKRLTSTSCTYFRQ